MTRPIGGGGDPQRRIRHLEAQLEKERTARKAAEQKIDKRTFGQKVDDAMDTACQEAGVLGFLAVAPVAYFRFFFSSDEDRNRRKPGR